MLATLTGTPRERVQKLRSILVNTVPGICAERARVYTECYQQFEFNPPILKRARALKEYLEKVSISFNENELLPGWQSSHPRWAPVFPEYSWDWVYEELDLFGNRAYDRFLVNERTKEELRDLLPFWKGRSLYERILARQPKVVLDSTKIGAISWAGQATSGEGHIVVDHNLALSMGFEGIRNYASQLLSKLELEQPDSIDKRDFYESVVIVFEGVLNYIQRFINLVEGELNKSSGDRLSELQKLAGDLQTLITNPAQNFRQALITVWLVHLIQQMESNGHSVSLGRFDQYLYSFFARDIKSGEISEQNALELLEHFYLKVFSIIKLRSASHTRTQMGYPTYQNLCVGGQTTNGKDATNPLTWLCLSALAEIRLSEPNFYIRLHPGTPDDFLQEALKVVRLGFGMPAFVNDEVIIPALELRGVSHEDAVNYSTVGCVEVLVPGKWGYRVNGKSKLNVLKVLELAINDGKDPKTKLQLLKGKGNLSQMNHFDEVLDAWHGQLLFYTRTHVAADNINDRALEEMVPNPFCSTLVQDCLGRGKHINAGGAIYDMTGGCQVGIPNVGNSLTAIKKLVFEQQLITKDELLTALKNNFDGVQGEEIRQLLLNRAPKYGEDDEVADTLTARALNDYCEIVSEFKDLRFGRGPIGGMYLASTNTVSANITAGEDVGASPDGRKQGEPTADGVSPSQGTGRAGPTAIFHSVSKLPTVKVTGGQLLNIRLNRDSISSDTAILKLAALVRGFFDLKGWHVQFNTISTSILKDAMLHPEKYSDLIVRVAGYSALFIALDPALQRDIIARMEHAI